MKGKMPSAAHHSLLSPWRQIVFPVPRWAETHCMSAHLPLISSGPSLSTCEWRAEVGTWQGHQEDQMELAESSARPWGNKAACAYFLSSGTSPESSIRKKRLYFPNTHELFHLWTSVPCTQSASNYSWETSWCGSLKVAFFFLTGCARGKVVVLSKDNDELKYWSAYLGAGKSCVALHLDYNESFSGLRHPVRFLTTDWKPQEAIMGWSQTGGARDRATPSAKATVAVHKRWFKRLKVLLSTFFHLLAWRLQLYFKCYRLLTATLFHFHVPAKVIWVCVSPLFGMEQTKQFLSFSCLTPTSHLPPLICVFIDVAKPGLLYCR